MFWMLVEFYKLTILRFYNHASAVDHGEYSIDVLACSICCECQISQKSEQISVLEQNLSESRTLGRDHHFQVSYS